MVDSDIIMINNMLKIIDMIRSIRNTKNIQLKKPLKKLTIYCGEDKKELIEKVENYILTEGNIIEMDIQKYEASKYVYSFNFNIKNAGKLFTSKIGEFKKFISEQSQESLKEMYMGNTLIFNEHIIDKNLVEVFQSIDDPIEIYEAIDEDLENKLKVKINIEMDENTNEMYIAKNIATSFQRLRKIGGFHVYDNLRLVVKENEFKDIIEKRMDYIMKTTRVKIEIVTNSLTVYDFKKEMIVNEKECEMYLIRD
jgi:isoleucyl-tRNA synthetase